MTVRYTISAESDGEKISKIGQHLWKLWAIKYRVVFFMKHGEYSNVLLCVLDKTRTDYSSAAWDPCMPRALLGEIRPIAIVIANIVYIGQAVLAK